MPPCAVAVAPQVHQQRPPRPAAALRGRRCRRPVQQQPRPAAPVAAAAQQPVQDEQRALGAGGLRACPCRVREPGIGWGSSAGVGKGTNPRRLGTLGEGPWGQGVVQGERHRLVWYGENQAQRSGGGRGHHMPVSMSHGVHGAWVQGGPLPGAQLQPEMPCKPSPAELETRASKQQL